MPRELTTTEVSALVPCPRGSVDFLAERAGVVPVRREERNGALWKLWPARSIQAIRRVYKKWRKRGNR